MGFTTAYEGGSILIATNLPFDEWTEVFGSELAHRRSCWIDSPTTFTSWR